MTTPVNCPNCGSQLPPGAPQCARCGERFAVEPEPTAAPAPVLQAPPPPKPASATPPPRVIAAGGTGPASSGDIGKAAQQYLSELRERWGLQPTPFLFGVITLVGAALFLGALAHIMVLTAGATDFDRRFDFFVWSTSATALALGAFVVAVLLRFEAPMSPVQADSKSLDFRVGVVLGGLTIVFALIGVMLGFGGHTDSAGTWARFAAMFSFVTATWFTVSQPVPPSIGAMKATTIGVIVGAFALAMLVVGQVFGLGSGDSATGGTSLQATAINVIVLALGWFLGMQPRRD